MKKIFILLLLIATVLKSNAQTGMGKEEDIEQVKSRQLIVMIETEQKETLKYIDKNSEKASIDDYRADIKTYNENIKMVVEKFWPYNKQNIQYKTFDEIRELRKAKNKDYVVLFSTTINWLNKGSWSIAHEDGLDWKSNIKDDFMDRKDGVYTQMKIELIEHFTTREVGNVVLYDVWPRPSSLIYGMQSLGHYFDMRMAGASNDSYEKKIMSENAPKLAEKTLLIRSRWVDKNLTKDSFREHYPYKFKICDNEEMDEIIIKQDTQYAYAVVFAQVNGGVLPIMLDNIYVFDVAGGQKMAKTKGSTKPSDNNNRIVTDAVLDRLTDEIEKKK